MPPIEAVTQGTEHLILLPSEDWAPTLPNTPPKETFRTGANAVVVSGFAIATRDGTPEPEGIPLHPDFPAPWGPGTTDEVVHPMTWQIVVGPEWRNVFQVSPSVSLAGVISWDSDEVDISRWVVRTCSWDTKQTLAGERIRLTIDVEIQGAENGIVNLAYQLVATGDLWSLPDFDRISTGSE